LAFPLNVFACALFLEEGSAEYLHYGLFDADHRTIAAAQQRSTDLVLRALPAVPCRILELGVGLGSTAKTLAARGYAVTGICPDPLQIAIARERAGAQADLQQVTFEDFAAPAGTFDCILAQESAQYIDAGTLFSKAEDLLVDGGRLVLLDQVALKRIGVVETGLHLETDLNAEARRRGFEAVTHTDLSADATPTLDYILRIIERHQAELLGLLQLDAGTLEALVASVARNRGRYREGILGYAFCVFVWHAAPGPRSGRRSVCA
jgi:cyclopropane fatty-acyl-phospholipid synthase-like methyltransferase